MNKRSNRNANPEAAIRKAKVNRDRARQKLLAQRKQLAERRTSNRERSERRKAESSSEDNDNPTNTSTTPRVRTNRENATRNAHSSVPEKPKYAAVTPRRRLYGLRFYEEREGAGSDGGDGEADTPGSQGGSDSTAGSSRSTTEGRPDE